MAEQCCGGEKHKHDENCNDNTSNPVLVNVTRGGVVESSHRGRICVVDIQGNIKLAMGDVESPIYPRSAIKIFQALPMALSGAIDKYNLTAQELSVICSSHSGEKKHTQIVQGILEKADLSVDDLECGIHPPTDKATKLQLIKDGEKPNPLHNNCSGKHSGMLLMTKIHNFPTKGYINPEHPVQQSIMGMIEGICEYSLEDSPSDKDGCSVPTWALPMTNLALGFAKVSDPHSVLPSDTADALIKLRDSVIEQPFMVAGTDRTCTKIIQTLKSRAFVKFGAEAVYTASLPEYGLGIVIKIDDGSERAVAVALLRILDEIGVLTDDDKKQLAELSKPTLKNFNDYEVGHIEPAF